MAHLEYGRFLTQQSRFEEAIAQMTIARENDPQSVRIPYETGWIYYCERQYDRAIELYNDALSVDPRSPQTHRRLGLAYAQKGMLEQAITETGKALQVREDPGYESDLGCFYATLGRKTEARGALLKLQELSKGRHVSPYYWARIYAALGDREHMYLSLKKAYDDHSDHLLDLPHERVFDSFRREAQFQDLIRRIGFAP